MKKSTITKKVTSITLAAMLALTAYMPAAAYATEETDDTATQTASDSAQPVAEEVEQQAEPVTVDQAPEKDQAPVAEENVPTVKDQAPAADKKAPAAEENPVAKSQAPAAEETTPAAEDEPAAKSPVPAAEETAPAAEDDPAQTEEDQPVAEESPYGVATGNWGYGNDRQGTRWDEYTKDGETILVFTIVGKPCRVSSRIPQHVRHDVFHIDKLHLRRFFRIRQRQSVQVVLMSPNPSTTVTSLTLMVLFTRTTSRSPMTGKASTYF